MSIIIRESSYAEVTTVSGAYLSSAFNMSDYAGGQIITASGLTDCYLGFKVSSSNTGDYVSLVDKAGLPVQITNLNLTVSRSYNMPDELFASKFVKIWSKSKDDNFTNVNQNGNRLFKILLKG